MITSSIILYLNVILSLIMSYRPTLYVRLSHTLKHYVMLCYIPRFFNAQSILWNVISAEITVHNVSSKNERTIGKAY